MEKLHVSAYSGNLQVLTTFLLKFLYNMPKPRGDVLSKKTLLARKLSKSEDDRYRPKHVVSPFIIIIIIYPYIYSCVFD